MLISQIDFLLNCPRAWIEGRYILLCYSIKFHHVLSLRSGG